MFYIFTLQHKLSCPPETDFLCMEWERRFVSFIFFSYGSSNVPALFVERLVLFSQLCWPFMPYIKFPHTISRSSNLLFWFISLILLKYDTILTAIPSKYAMMGRDSLVRQKVIPRRSWVLGVPEWAWLGCGTAGSFTTRQIPGTLTGLMASFSRWKCGH